MKFFLLQHGALRSRFVRDRVHFGITRRAEIPVVPVLAVSGLIVRHAKEPASNVFLRTTRGQVPVQDQKSVLHDVRASSLESPRQTRYRSKGLRNSRYRVVASHAPVDKRESGRAKGAASPLMNSSSSRFYVNNK
jgi:hypothetical protein